MAKPAARIQVLQILFGFGILAVLGRAGWLQLVKGREISKRAEALRTAPRELMARRGTIYDRNGTPLVISQPKFRVQIALREVRDTTRLLKVFASDLGIRSDTLRRSFRRGTPRYPYFHGPFTARQVNRLRGMKGVYFETTYSRSYPNGVLASPIVGRLDPDGVRGASGLERTLDTLLAGVPGLTTDLREVSGRRIESPGRLIRQPVAGHDVTLTLDAELQAIAEYTLSKSVRDFHAQGGDVVFLDPRSGELLALASIAPGDNSVSSFFTTPFEPGSTAKPFTAAALLTLNRVTPTETVSGNNGTWTFVTTGRSTRTIRDVHPESGELTLARAIQKSSNIAVAKFSLKLRPEEQYDMLRRFGFGAPTGVEFPSEAVGSFIRPHRWRFGYDAQSVAMGYSFSVTPVQLAIAYGALANDGLLLAPTLVREVRTTDGATIFRHEPEVIRRAISPEVAATIREFLNEAASDSGTGGRAQVRGGILGKTGTALVAERGGYQKGEYRASFAAIYPATEPQLVVVVTIDRPQGAYFGGVTAAPVTAEMLRQALAAKTGIDKTPLGEVAPDSGLGTRGSGLAARDSGPGGPESVVNLSNPEPQAPNPEITIVPDVAGRSLRAAVYALHQRGFRVRVEGSGRPVRTSPAAGDSLPTGRLVVLYAVERTP